MVNRKHLFFSALICLLVLIGCGTSRNSFNSKDLSPYDYGLKDARTGEERFQVLYTVHQIAKSRGVNVDYGGIGKLYLTIPKDAKSIPLGLFNNFGGVEFIVENQSKNMPLFIAENHPTKISVTKGEIDKGRFSVPALRKGTYLLAITDDKPWVENRAGYSYGHIRKDLLVIHNGKSQNSVIMPYDNVNSSPSCLLYPQQDRAFVFSNVSLTRSEKSTFRTELVMFKGYNQLTISNIKVVTPVSRLTGDGVIKIYDCANVHLTDVVIDGTYSKKDDSGYGISMNNVYSFDAERLTGKANWGLFGDNNVNCAKLKQCHINRFDVHCYARDISFEECVIEGMANQFSSLYGRLSFHKCHFIDATPVMIEYTYNCYTPFDLEIIDCSWDVSWYRKMIIYVGYLDDKQNSRPELAEKSWPNVIIKNLTINTVPEVSRVMLFYIKGEVSQDWNIDHISEIDLDNIQIQSALLGKKVEFVITNAVVHSKNDVHLRVRNSSIKPLNSITRSSK